MNKLPKKQENFLQIYKKNAGLIGISCNNSNIARGTYYLWLKNPKFKDAIDQANEEFLDYGESKLIELLKDKNPQVVLHFAKTKLKHRGYGEASEITYKGEGFKLVIENEDNKMEADE